MRTLDTSLISQCVYRLARKAGTTLTPACHALLEKAPGLVMASAGPDILDAHSVDERAPLDTLADYALLLAGLLEEGLS